MGSKKPDFGGWVTKNDLKCSDGKTIRHGAFKHMNGVKVPLMWQHTWNEPSAVLGYVVLEHRDAGVYGYGYFNDTDNGRHAKLMVEHGDIESLSIHANRLQMSGKDVLHGDIKEVSLVLSGANPGAFIDPLSMAHGDSKVFDEAVIYTGETIEHADNPPEITLGDTVAEETDADVMLDPSEVYESMSQEQKDLVQLMMDRVAEGTIEAVIKTLDEEDDEDEDEDVEEDEDEDIEHSDFIDADDFLTHIDTRIQEGFNAMSRNVFDQNDAAPEGKTLTHAQVETIISDAQNLGSFKDSYLKHAQEYGIEDIDILFPDAKVLGNTPEYIKRRTEWVDVVLSGTRHSPMSKVKTRVANITADEARAKGYVKGTRKKEEIIRLLKRTTAPATIYKKQKLDRDDIVDITDFDVVVWLKGEMRLLLDEEIARSILLGDGRDPEDADKIKDPTGAQDGIGIRSIVNDDEMYAHPVSVGALEGDALVDEVLRARTFYRGTGTPDFFTTDRRLTEALLAKDDIGRRLYDSVEKLASAMRVGRIIPVEVMEEYPEVVGIMVSLTDYTVGADKGGQVSMFDDFDIDYNQEKYLLETRISGGLTKPKAAVVFKTAELVKVTPQNPGFDPNTKKIEIPNQAGVDYRIGSDKVTGSVKIDKTTEVTAHAKTGFVFPTEITTSWTFTIG